MALGIGEALRAERRRQDLTLADAAADTRIRETYLAALEEEQFATLGGDVYVKGFIRSYARFLGMDPEPLLEAYQGEDGPPGVAEQTRPAAPRGARRPPNAQAAGHVPRLANRPVGAMPGAVPGAGGSLERARPNPLVLLAGAVLLAMVVFAIIGARTGPSPEDEVGLAPGPAPATPTATPTFSPSPGTTGLPGSPGTAPGGVVDPLATASPSPGPTGEEGVVEVDGDVELVLALTGEGSWVRVIVDGERELEDELPGGASRTFRGSEVFLRIGNAGAAHLTVNGRDLGVAGSPAQVVERTFRSRGTGT